MSVGHYTRKSVDLIIPTDEALADDDTPEEQIKRYYKYLSAGCDESLLVFKDNAKPTRFRCDRMPYAARMHSYELDGDPKLVFVFRASFKSVSGYRVSHDRGQTTDLPPVELEDSPQFGPMVKAKWLENADLPIGVIRWVAKGCMDLSEGRIPFVGSSTGPATDGG